MTRSAKYISTLATALSLSATLCLPSALSASGNAGSVESSTQLLKVTSLNIDPASKDLVILFDVDTRHIKPGRDREVIFVPILRSITTTDSIVLPSFTVAGRNRYYSHLRNGDLADGDVIAMAGDAKPLRYYYTVPLESWMSRSRIDVDQLVGHCCDKAQPEGDTPVAEIDLTPRAVDLPFEYVALLGDSLIQRKAEGRAYVNFVVNRTELKPDYMNNPEEIGKIIASIDLVKSDPEAVITDITIKGYASPEGPYTNNVRLAMGRTQTLKEYVRNKYDFDPAIMSSDYEPEDWQGLRDWLVEHEIPNRDAILRIVDSNMEPDPKNAEIQRRYPAEYAMILKEVYPWLRHSDYTIKYTFRIFTDVEELKRVYSKTPDRLRPVDFQRIAATYPVGSDDFNAVMMTAVKVWPYNELANLNAANIAMAAGDLQEAANYLTKAGSTPEAIYTRGVLAARRGDLNRASVLMQDAREAGVAQAAAALQAIDAEKQRPTVTYFLTPTEE